MMTAKEKAGSGSEPEKPGGEAVEAAPQETDNDEAGQPHQENGSGEAGEPEDLESILEASEQKAADAYDKYLRVSADFENYKKRSAREMGDLRKYANESLIRELLPVVDSIELAIGSATGDDDVSSFVEGVDLTLKSLLKVFEKFVVKPIEAIGKPFDPTFHQAVMQEASDDQPENTVLKELQKGYTIHDRLLRPTMVVVSTTTPGETIVNEADQD